MLTHKSSNFSLTENDGNISVKISISSIQKKFYEKQKDVEEVAEEFYFLINMMRYISSKYDTITVHITAVSEHLKLKLEEINKFNKEIQNLHQTMINAKTFCQREYNVKCQEIKDNDINIDEIEEKRDQKIRRIYEIIDEKRFHDFCFERLQQDSKTLFVTNLVAHTGNLMAAGAALLATPFTVVAVPFGSAIFGIRKLYKTGAENVNTKLKIIENENNMRKSECEILLGPIKNDKFLEEIKTLEQELENISKMRNISESDLLSTSKTEETLKILLMKTNLWSTTIQKWIQFLVIMEPIAQRISKNLKLSYISTYKSLRDFNQQFRTFNVYEIQNEAHNLAATNSKTLTKPVHKPKKYVLYVLIILVIFLFFVCFTLIYFA